VIEDLVKSNLKKNNNMHKQRILTAVIALPLIIILILKGGAFLFSVLICLVSLLSLREYFRITHNIFPYKGFFWISTPAFLFTPALIYSAYYLSYRYISAVIVLELLTSSLVLLHYYNSDKSMEKETLIGAAFNQIHGFIYISLFLSTIVMLHVSDSYGIEWVFLLLLLVFAGDTGAYYTGTYLGKHKLCPEISPNKTIEGFVGGILLSIILGSVFKLIFLPEIPWNVSLMVSCATPIAGAVGDMYESAIKRTGKIKDSGRLLPGHGGILDRIDGLIFAAPVLFFIKEFLL